MELAEELEVEGFKASNHWLENFKERHGIKFRTEQGEAAAVDQEVVATWQETVLKEALSKYAADDVFNADETGLFWRLMPNKTLAFKGKVLTILAFTFAFRREVFRRKEKQRARHCFDWFKCIRHREASVVYDWKISQAACF